MPVEDRQIVSEHTVEVRHQALGRLLDIRGHVADWIFDHTDFRHWSISDNRVDFRVTQESQRELAFVSHQNFGYAVRRPDTRNYLPDRAMRFVHEVLSVGGYELKPVVRFGVRARVLLPYQGRFQALVNRVIELMPVPANLRPLNAEVEDVGPVLVLRRGETQIKLQVGPMELQQSKGLFQGHENLPDVGFYIDQDHSQANLGRMSERDIATILRSLHTQVWEVIDFYNRLLL